MPNGKLGQFDPEINNRWPNVIGMGGRMFRNMHRNAQPENRIPQTRNAYRRGVVMRRERRIAPQRESPAPNGHLPKGFGHSNARRRRSSYAAHTPQSHEPAPRDAENGIRLK